MPVLLQRRFRLCVAKDVQSTQIAALGALAITDGAKAPGPEGSMAGLKAVRFVGLCYYSRRAARAKRIGAISFR